MNIKKRLATWRKWYADDKGLAGLLAAARQHIVELEPAAREVIRLKRANAQLNKRIVTQAAELTLERKRTRYYQARQQ